MACSVKFAFRFVWCLGIVILDSNANNENRPNLNLFDATVPKVICDLRIFTHKSLGLFLLDFFIHKTIRQFDTYLLISTEISNPQVKHESICYHSHEGD